MHRKRLLAALALAMAAGLSACSQPGNSAGANQQAAERFLTERNGGTPVALGEDGHAQNMTTLGTVEQVAGDTIVVKDKAGASTTIRLAADAKVYRQVAAQPSEIQAGDPIAAFGTRNGAILQADSIQIGGTMDSQTIVFGEKADTLAQGGGAPIIDTGGSQQHKGDLLVAGKGDHLPAGSIVSGTVERVAGDTIVVKDKAGTSTTVQLTGETKIHKQAMVEASAIEAGQLIMARGTQQRDEFQATQVNILASAPAP